MNFILCIANKRRYEVGGVITLILNKEEGALAIYMVCRGGGCTEILIFSTYFSLPPLHKYNWPVPNSRTLIHRIDIYIRYFHQRFSCLLLACKAGVFCCAIHDFFSILDVATTRKLGQSKTDFKGEVGGMGFKRPLVSIPLLFKMGPRSMYIRVSVKKRLLCSCLLYTSPSPRD